MQNDHNKVIINVIVRLVLSLLKVNSHTTPRTTVMSSKQAIRLSKQDVIKMGDSTDTVKRNW